MDKDQSEQWARDRQFQFSYYKYPDEGVGENRKIGKEGYWVSGWAYPKDPKKDKTRIHKIGSTLEEAVEKVKAKYDEVVR